ncbi:transmembrane protein, putative [Medicago truncatula]|uniref:Transmembrane protein, putative n=1 Tax=Medicago truncatula TaxID=3880 RepID=G7J184_MEDTR|nr:transmembrane protein, putative [Medicago truncatula]
MYTSHSFVIHYYICNILSSFVLSITTSFHLIVYPILHSNLSVYLSINISRNVFPLHH